MYVVELVNLKTKEQFVKVFYDKFLADRFIVKCKKGKSLRVKGLKVY